MTTIGEVYTSLSINSNAEILDESMNILRAERELSLLIMPKANAFVWECCAKVLSEKTDEELQPYLYKLLEWLMDLNWPGALVILDRLKCFSGSKLLLPFSACIESAKSLNNDEGNRWLYYLYELLENASLKEILPNHIIEELQIHRCAMDGLDED